MGWERHELTYRLIIFEFNLSSGMARMKMHGIRGMTLMTIRFIGACQDENFRKSVTAISLGHE